jgi:hypothetical protein
MWPISSCKKVRKCCNPHVYWWNRIGFKQSHFVEDLVATPRCMFLVSLFWRWDVVSLTLLHTTKWECLKPILFHQYTWGLQHFLNFLQEDIGHIKCYWFKINYLFLSTFYIANIQMWKGQLKSYFIQELLRLHHLPNFWQEPYSFMHIYRQCITTV